MPNIPKIDVSSELRFRASRSSGAGGQHVNKVSTRIEVLFDVNASAVLNASQKLRIHRKLGNRINKEGILIVAVDEERSQDRNKRIAIKRVHELLEIALRVPKKRKPTKVSKAAKERRLKKKKIRGEVKELRKKPGA